MKNFLYISPKFPPNNAIGSRRALNIVRHVQKHGWFPIVLAAPVPEQDLDTGMSKLLPGNTRVYYQFGPENRKKTKVVKQDPGNKRSFIDRISERGPYYTPFDQYLLQVPQALSSGKKLIGKYQPEFILVNADPWSGLLAGHLLSRWANIPWIADLRDPWSLHKFKMDLRPAPIRYLVTYFESLFFHSAAKIILNTRTCCNAYQEKYRNRIDNHRFTFIRNAFDPGCFKKPAEEPSGNKFSLHYFGSFRVYQDSGPLFPLFTKFVEKYQLTPEQTEVVLYGALREEESRLIQSLGIMPYIKIKNAVKPEDALVNLNQASVLILIEGPNKCLQLPVKLYDYMAAKKPVFALTDNPELAEIINTTRCGVIAPYKDADKAVEVLSELYQQKDKPWHLDEAETGHHTADYQVSEFARIFSEIYAAGKRKQTT